MHVELTECRSLISVRQMQTCFANNCRKFHKSIWNHSY